jgi:hydroxymethylpyrimidine pyrophosphatase-like HAD family hydrolase
MAGKSSRFPNTRPKWMLSHPSSNRFMGIESITGLNLDFFENIYFICLEEHETQYQFLEGFKNELRKIGVENKSEIILLKEKTESQSETIFNAIKEKNIEGFIFVKDSDNYFDVEIKDQSNQICYFDLNSIDGINARNKSYIQLDTNGIVSNIVEKKVISSNFSVGGYGFSDAYEFCKNYENLKDIEGECYISNIIFEMLLSGKTFTGTNTLNYKDWGTLEDWNKYKETYKTLFVDLDGTLVTNTSHLFPPYIGEGTPLQNNIDYLNKLYSSGRVRIVITTSRPKEYYQDTINELKNKQIPFDEIIMGLPHSQRILINDFARSNPYPSCSSLNIPRNSDNLEDYFL